MSDKFKGLWDESDEVEYNSNTPISKIMEFIDCLVKKKGDWTKSRGAAKVLHDIFASLSKTSPEVCLDDWEKNGDLHPSPEATLWLAAIRVLGCAFVLKSQIRQTVKSILKNDMKDLQFRGKKLIFDPACVPTETKTGRFLTNKVTRQHFAKRQCAPKQFDRKYQSFIKVTICGNMFGVRKYDHFVKHFREMMNEIMKFEPRLVIIPYPDRELVKKSRRFANNCSMLSSSYWYQIYIDTLYIPEGRPTTVKIFVGHDMPPAAFNSKECAQVAYELDGTVCLFIIQASKVLGAGYLQGSTKMLDDCHGIDHWKTLNFILI